MTQTPLPGKYALAEEVTINAAVDTWAPQVSRSYALGQRDRGLGAGRHCDIRGFGGMHVINETRTLGRDALGASFSAMRLSRAAREMFVRRACGTREVAPAVRAFEAT